MTFLNLWTLSFHHHICWDFSCFRFFTYFHSVRDMSLIGWLQSSWPVQPNFLDFFFFLVLFWGGLHHFNSSVSVLLLHVSSQKDAKNYIFCRFTNSCLANVSFQEKFTLQKTKHVLCHIVKLTYGLLLPGRKKRNILNKLKVSNF